MAFLRAAFIAFVAVGCSQVPGAPTSTKSLEGLAANGEVINTRCSAAPDRTDKEPVALSAVRFQEGMPAARQTALTASVSQALSAVPTSLQRLLVKLGGDIRVTADVDAICRASFQGASSRAKTGRLQSCFVTIGSQGGKQSHLSIVVADSELAVQTSLVRAFGYFLSQYVTRLYRKADGQLELHSAVDGALAQKMSAITDAFVEEVRGSGRFDRQRFEAWVEATPALTLSGYVYAEAFDSWNCHPFGGAADTRARMQSTFPKTAALFAALDGIVESQLTSFVSPLAKKSAGLSLQDGTPAADTPTPAAETSTPLISAVPDSSSASTEPAVDTTPAAATPPTTTSADTITVTIVDDSGTLDAKDVTVDNPTDKDVVVNIVPGTPPAAGDTVVTTGGTQPDQTPATTPPATADEPAVTDNAADNGRDVTDNGGEVPAGGDPGFDMPQGEGPPADSGEMVIDSFPPGDVGDSSMGGGSGGDFGGWEGGEAFAAC